MERLSTASIKAFFLAALGVSVYLAITRPLTFGEATLWNDLVRPSARAAFFAPDAWSGWLYALLAKRTVGLFRLSELTLRLPAILAGICYLALLPRRQAFLIFGAVPVALSWFSIATGYGLALAFCAAAWRWQRVAPILLGLAIASSPVFALPLGIVAVVSGLGAIEKVAIPALVTAFVLLIVPLSRAAEPVKTSVGSREEAAVRSALQPLRGQALRISAPPDILPLVEFYKASYRQRQWQITDRDPQVRLAF